MKAAWLAATVPQATASLTQTVEDWRRSGPRVVPMPHPSPRHNLWLKRNPWFEAELLPMLKLRVAQVLADEN